MRELKAHIEQYLNEVEAGERIIVRDNTHEIALITPVGKPQEEAGVEALVKSGRATWAGGKPRGACEPVKNEGKPVSDIVGEDRR
jgi:antitoxin (DNA-binding transcriptional repressor) of toxin-antitoxin stability system